MPPVGGSTKASAARGGGRGRRRSRVGQSEHEEGSERWLVTYADMLTVLLALFIVLFAISALNEAKFQQLKYSLAAVFGDGSVGVLDGSPALNQSDRNDLQQPPTVPDTPPTTDPAVPAVPNLGGWIAAKEGAQSGTDTSVADSETTKSGVVVDTGSEELNEAIVHELDNFAQIKQNIDAHLDSAGMTGAVEYSIDERGLIVTVITNALVFPDNSATLLPRGQKLLAAITPALKKVPNNIEVDGFTNQVDVSTAPYPSGWELSSARASSVVRYIESHGLGKRQLSAVGFSDQKPLVPPDDPKSVTRNRRVEIVVLSSLPALAGDALVAQAQKDAHTHKDAQNTRTSSSKNGSPAARGAHAGSTVPPTAGHAPDGPR